MATNGSPACYKDINTPGRRLSEVKTRRGEGEHYLHPDLPSGATINHSATKETSNEDSLWNEAVNGATGNIAGGD